MTISYLKITDIQARFGGRSRCSLYNDINNGLLTPPVHFSKKFSVWPVHEIDAIAAARLAGCSNDEIKKLIQTLKDARTTDIPNANPA